MRTDRRQLNEQWIVVNPEGNVYIFGRSSKLN